MHNAPKSSLYFYSLLVEIPIKSQPARSDGFIEIDAFEDIRTALHDLKKSFAVDQSTRNYSISANDVVCVCLNQIR